MHKERRRQGNGGIRLRTTRAIAYISMLNMKSLRALGLHNDEVVALTIFHKKVAGATLEGNNKNDEIDMNAYHGLNIIVGY